jgi:hypothetical protein
MAELITKPQIKKIFAMAKQLGMDEVDLRGLAYNLTGSESISTMTKKHAGRLIDYLNDRSRGDYRPQAVSRQQLYLMKKMAAELGWSNPRQLAGFIKRQAGVENERWLDANGARKVIEGLKKVLERSKKGNVNSQKGGGG